ncbi:TVP38/TMEM64 family protein [Phormidium sp. CLA17]|uniref:TVP38/TMEM64 family protein n=1 Tax=Leptolyngbya sp. Cla-17 TaxID=2803751 RepID=UPI0014914AD1|nr:TVP38/TMEM64 family protein [Leptolyngbya sp. Cla-17]MBM0743077.1 TVP38/TMEM64 family protein [Leptolyngbya sp. Cla-17]
MNLIELIQTALQNSLVWVKDLGAIGVVAYILIYNLATVLFIPGSLLTLGGGAIYGVVWGSLYVFIAATLGATLAFLIGRYLAQAWVSKKIAGNTTFNAISAAVAKDGFKIVLLTRLSPIFPFTLLNYAFGVTKVSLKDYILGSIGMLPGTILYVYLGSLAGNLTGIAAKQPLSSEAQAAQWVIRIIGLVATIAVTFYLTRIAKKALAESVSGNPVNVPPTD